MAGSRRTVVVYTLTVVVSTLAMAAGACAARGRHNAVIASGALYEALNGVHQAEQAALAQHVSGWTVEKSQRFNRALLPAVEAGRQYNLALQAWVPGQPLPEAVRNTVKSLTDALKAVTEDMGDGSTKAAVLAHLAQAQQVALAVLALATEVR